jgi:hypothetical protein
MRNAALAAALCLWAAEARAAVVISQVYGGGGSGTPPVTFTNDYVELYNNGSASVTITGWTIQYASASASATTSWTLSTALSGSIAPGKYFLVKVGTTGAAGGAMPAPDATSSAPSMSATDGRVAVVANATALVGCPTSGWIDMVGYGTSICFEGAATAAISKTTAAARKRCNDTDNNAADFEILATPSPRNSASPACTTCGASDTICDGLDDDCNTLIDEEYAPETTNCGVGACAATGMSSCAGGQVQQNCTPGTPAADDATCNNVDEDCSGQKDEDFVPAATSCGNGPCAATGVTTCVAGVPGNTCTPLPPTANTDPSCNNVDDDCDGLTDEEYASDESCFLPGACEEGNVGSSCAAGVVSPCVAGDPLSEDDATCDGVDDDCNGEADEEYSPHATICGVGGCERAGVSACPSGEEQNVCTPGDPAANDTSCNGTDDDCDTQTDEEYAPAATACGVGACASAGVTSCEAGGVHDSCAAGTPALTDADCDGVDDDCSGAADEDYVPTPTACGTGACAATGITACEDGVVQYICTPGGPGAADADCDDVDDDCDGSTDEEYVPTSTACGEGPCASTGNTYCRDGEVRDTCTPRPDGTACPDENLCNGNETCQAGVCKSAPGTQPIACAAADECHAAGSCVAQTGLCSNPAVADGTKCSLGTCQSGTCTEAPAGGCSCGTPGGAAPLLGLLALLVAKTRSGRRRRDPGAA